jgi:hypothetical protein
MRRSALPWLILATVLVSAGLAWWTLTRGGGGHPPPRQEHIELAPFHAIEVGGAANVTLLQGDAESIDVEAPGRRVRLGVNVTNGRLVIAARDRRRWWSALFGRRETEPATITVRFRRLDAIALTGTVKLGVPSLTTQALRITASGGATLSIDDLRATSLRVEGSGALHADLAGRVDEEKVSISGAGAYRADRLHATDATVSVSGVGNVLLHAERTLRASISGAGLIEYVGDPAVTEHVSGIGRIKRREAAPPAGMRIAATRDQCSASAPGFLKKSGPPVIGSTSACTPPMTRTSEMRQSRMSAASISPASCTASYG